MGLRSEVDKDRTRTVENRLGSWTSMRCVGLKVMDGSDQGSLQDLLVKDSKVTWGFGRALMRVKVFVV